MKERPWYKRYPSDFLHGTAGMPLEMKGAYSVVLDLIFDRGGPIPDDARWIAGHCGCSVRLWNRLRHDLIEAGKLCSDGAKIWNDRALKELGAAAETARKLAENGAKGGNKSAETRRNLAIIQGGLSKNNDLDEAGLEPPLNHTRAFQRLEIDTPIVPKGGEVGGSAGQEAEQAFAEFKAAYPKRDGGQDWARAQERFMRHARQTAPADMIQAAKAYRAEVERQGKLGTAFVKQAATFLTTAWQDYRPGSQQAAPLASLPAGWPSHLPPPDAIGSAWLQGKWHESWGPRPGAAGCILPPAVLADWQRHPKAREVGAS